MSIFDEGVTITSPGSPEGQEPAGGAVPGEDQNDDDQTELDGEEFDQEDDDQSDESDNYDDEDGEPSDDDEDNSNKDNLILGKFKSPDDLAKAYANLEKAFHTRNQPPAPGQPPVQQPGQQPPANGQADPTQLFWQHFQQDPINTMRYLIENAVAAKTAPIMEKSQSEALAKTIDAVSKDYKQIKTEQGMGQLLEKVRDIAEELGNPSLAQNPSQRVLRMAAAEAFGESKQTVYNKAKTEGRVQAEAARQRKRGLDAPRGSKQKGNEQPLSEEDQMRQGILAAGRGGTGLFG